VTDGSRLFAAHRDGIHRYLTRLVGETEAGREYRIDLLALRQVVRATEPGLTVRSSAGNPAPGTIALEVSTLPSAFQVNATPV